MKADFKENKKLHTAAVIIIATVAVLLVTFAPKAFAANNEATQDERNYIEEGVYPCGNHTFSYVEPKLLDGVYASNNENFYFVVNGDEIELHGTEEQISETTAKHLVNITLEEYLSENEERFSLITSESPSTWNNGVHIRDIITMHFSSDNPDTIKVADKTLIYLESDETSDIVPFLIYEVDENNSRIIYGDEAFEYIG